MQIGLIGGIGPAATDYYYRRLISAFAAQKSHLDLTIVHADTPTLLNNLNRNDKAAQADIFVRLTQRLAISGASFVAITSIAGHFCRDAFQASSPLPSVDIISEVNRAVGESGLSRVGILGTRTVMDTQFYRGLTTTTVIPSTEQDTNDVHNAYVTMAASGTATDGQRKVFDRVSRRLLDDGAEAILLGGTDLALVYDQRTSELPVIDCAGIHVDAIVRRALES
jgi:aspartate racemase